MLTKEASKTVLHVFKDRFLVSRNDRNDNNSYFLDTPFFVSSNDKIQTSREELYEKYL